MVVTPENFPSATIHFGTCAWSFDDWRGVFYPSDLPRNRWLGWYGRYLPAVEIDSTFYAAPPPRVVAQWLDATSDHFRFACKMPREITHDLRLRDCSTQVQAFLDAITPLSPKLGPILIQLPPAFSRERDEAALRSFVMALPRDFTFAVEFRHSDWHVPRIVSFLQDEGIGWAWTDTSPLAEQNRAAFEFIPLTAGFLYVRLLGDLATKYRADGGRVHRYGSLMWPREESIDSWALKVKKHACDVSCIYMFANNHFEGYSPLTCQRIASRFGVSIALPSLAAAPAPARDESQLDLL